MEEREVDTNYLFTLGYLDMLPFTTFVCVNLAVICIASVFKLAGIPLQLTAVIFGLIFGTIFKYVDFINLEDFRWNGRVDLMLFPIILIKLLYTLDLYVFKKSWRQVALISIFTQLVSVFCLGFTMIKLFGGQSDLFHIIISGLILVPNDVPQMIMELEGIKSLEVIMTTESLFSILFYNMYLLLLIGQKYGIISEWYQFVCLTIRYLTFGLLMGFAFSLVIPFMFRYLYDDSVNAIVIIISSVFGLYGLCENWFYCNGCLGVFILFMFLNPERTKLPAEVDQNVINFINTSYNNIEILFASVYSSFIMSHLLTNFHYLHLIMAVSIYLMGMILRMIVLLVLTPVLSRIGLGFNLTSMIAVFWNANKGPIQLLYGTFMVTYGVDKDIGREILSVVITFVILNYIFNAYLLKFILIKCKLIKISTARQSNINIGFKIIEERKARLLSVMKMNRFFSDANWPLIQESTKLKNPFKGAQSNDDFMYLYWTRKTVCPICTKTIAVDPTKNELAQMLREVRLRVLKAERISFIRQYEGGFLSKQEIKILLQAVALAMDSNELVIKLDALLKIFRKKHAMESVRHFMKKIRSDSLILPPKQKFRKICYYIMNRIELEIIVYVCIIVNFGAVLEMNLFIITESGMPFYWDVTLTCIFYLIYLIEFFIKFFGLSGESYKHGFKLYLRNHWHKLDFAILLISSIDLLGVLAEIVAYFASVILWNEAVAVIRLLRILRILRIFKLVSYFYPKILIRLEKVKDDSISHAYTLAKALIMAYDEAIELLPVLADNEKIREIIKTSLDNDKLIIINELGSLEKERPWVTVTVKTKQLIMATLICMKNGVQNLRFSGFVDRFEYRKLLRTIDQSIAKGSRYEVIQPIEPKSVFSEVGWMCNDEAVVEFLYNNVITKIWNANEVIIKEGDMLEGIMVLVAGMFRVTYRPTKSDLESLKNYGALPIKDVLSSTRLSEPQVDFVIIGNCIGELSSLTGRPYSCTITTYYPSQAFIIPLEMLKEAYEISSDPLNGLACRMWKYITFNLCRRILLETPIYQSTSHDVINEILDRAIVPNISYFKIIVLCNLVEDILLLEGLVVDFNTREIFTAPCYIPRMVNKIMLHHAGSLVVKELVSPKLLIIPKKDVDEYDAMIKIESLSELLPGVHSPLSTWGVSGKPRRKKKQAPLFVKKSSLDSDSSRMSTDSYIRSSTSSNKSGRTNFTETSSGKGDESKPNAE